MTIADTPTPSAGTPTAVTAAAATLVPTTPTTTRRVQHPGTTPRGATAAATLELIERSRSSLLEACHSRGVAQRYRQSQLAAMRAAAALLSARAPSSRAPGPRSLWNLVPAAAPELTEWAEFFALTTSRAGSLAGATPAGALGPVSAREADDLLRQTETFVDLVCRVLELPVTVAHGDVLVPTAWA